MEKQIFGYWVDSRGFVWNKKHTAPLKGSFDKNGYKRVHLAIDGESKTFFEHRLVALAFVDNPNPDKYTVVNHLDCSRDNNVPENLEWTDVKGNTKYGYDYGAVKTAQQKATAAAREVVSQHIEVYYKGTYIGTSNNKTEAAQMAHCDNKTVYNCLRENRPSRLGYTFIKVGDESCPT